MKYMGSKARHAKEMLPIILADRKPGQWYVEPFVGGANMIDKVDGPRIGNDAHPHLIALWKAVSDGWTPPDLVTEADYKALQADRPESPICGYVGFSMSFGGKWFGGYRRDKVGIDRTQNEIAQSAQSKRSALKQFPKLAGVRFRCGSYVDLNIPANSIIYCDPPYSGTTKYATGGFDHAGFWGWCDQKAADGHAVFVSEYSAPSHWRCLWSKEVNNTLTKDTGSKRGVERLFSRY